MRRRAKVGSGAFGLRWLKVGRELYERALESSGFGVLSACEGEHLRRRVMVSSGAFGLRRLEVERELNECALESAGFGARNTCEGEWAFALELAGFGGLERGKN